MEKVAQALLVISDGVEFADDRLVEVVSIPGREVGQAVVLQPANAVMSAVILAAGARRVGREVPPEILVVALLVDVVAQVDDELRLLAGHPEIVIVVPGFSRSL